MELNKVYQGNSIDIIRTMPSESVDCVVTSPPYYGLRDYGHPGQIGLEESPSEFIEKLVDLFREIRRVLKPQGTCWVNLGDSYSGNCSRMSKGRHGFGEKREGVFTKGGGLPSKNLIGIPWMFAFAMRNDGWYLRQDIIWHKPNAMPESVTDNDGLPFSLDDLTISPVKWRTESLKAYGNAIVPQVMYEIFRAIELIERKEDKK